MKQLLQNWVGRQAEVRPDTRCIVYGGESLTYRGLERRSNQLAHLLRQSGCQRATASAC